MTRADDLRAVTDKAKVELRLVECKLIGLARTATDIWRAKAPGLDFAMGALAALSAQQEAAQEALLAAYEAEDRVQGEGARL